MLDKYKLLNMSSSENKDIIIIIIIIITVYTDFLTTVGWKALGQDCTNNNGLILKIGVLSFYVINGDIYHTVFASFRYLSVYIKVLYIYIDP